MTVDSIRQVLTQEQRWDAIARAFAQFIEGDAVSDAKRLWLAKYAEKPSFALNHFVGECCKLFQLGDRRKEIIQVALRELIIQQHGGTATSATASDVTKAAAGEASDPSLVVFQLVINQLTLLAGKEAGQGVRRYVMANLERVELAGTTRRELQFWLSGSQPHLESSIPLPSMQLMVNLAYVSLCEYCGPVKADFILNEAVRDVAQLPEASGFDPSRLL